MFACSRRRWRDGAIAELHNAHVDMVTGLPYEQFSKEVNKLKLQVLAFADWGRLAYLLDMVLSELNPECAGEGVEADSRPPDQVEVYYLEGDCDQAQWESISRLHYL